MVTILFTRHYEMLKEKHVQKIKSVAEDVTIIIQENVLDVIPDVDILIAGNLDKHILKKAQKLQWVHALAAGVNRLLFPEFVESDIILTNSSGVHPVPIAEHVLGLMLLFSRGLHESVKNQLQKEWKRPQPTELYKKTLGIIGFGAIGERIGYVGTCLGMYVIGLKKHLDTKKNAHELLPPERLDELLQRSDFVVVSLPLTKETEHLISERELMLMKKTAYLINISRGNVICEPDLIKALQNKEIAGAGLDVFAEEPLPVESPLWVKDTVVITPHYAGSTPEYFNRAIDIFCENLKRFLHNEPMINVVDKKRGY